MLKIWESAGLSWFKYQKKLKKEVRLEKLVIIISAKLARSVSVVQERKSRLTLV